MEDFDLKPDPLIRTTEQKQHGSITLLVFLILSSFIMSTLYYTGAFDDKNKTKPGDDMVFSNLYNYYEISPLPTSAFKLIDLTTHFLSLSREPCNGNSLKNATDLLSNNKFKSEAVQLLLAYSDKCPNSVGALIVAGDLLLSMGNYEGSLELANKATHLNPTANLASLLRAEALRMLGRYQEALDSYSDFIESYADQSKIVPLVFTNMALSYAAAGKYCEAASTLQTYIAFDYSHRRSHVFNNEIENYEHQGRCGTAYAKGHDEIIPIAKGIILAKAEIDGVAGNFQIDTGASFVNVSPEFARKLNLKKSGDNLINLSTANGGIDAKMITLSNVRLGGLSASNVPAAILTKTIRKDIDGLLGLSFLSRFYITTRGNLLTISSSSKSESKKNR